MSLTFEEKLNIAQKLQKFSVLFRSFWEYSEIQFSTNKSRGTTASVGFNKDDGSPININVYQDFWDKLDENSRLFVLCHEHLHILLNHGKRFLDYIKDPKKIGKLNKASDVVINHMLCDYFGFDRDKLDDFIKNEGCWIDTVFKKNKNIKKDQSTEYYLAHLENESEDQMPSGFDIHEFFESYGDSNAMGDTKDKNGNPIQIPNDLAEKIDEFLQESGIINDVNGLNKELCKVLENEDKGRFAGLGTGGFHSIIKRQVKKKKKWETVIKKWESKFKKDTLDYIERWDRINPRFYDLLSQNRNIKLPTNNIIYEDFEEKSRIDVFFFLDVSGSCFGYKDRFHSAARTLDPKKFNLRVFSFDTAVQELELAKFQVYGGGGTAFDIIETKVQQIIKKDKIKKYPFVWLLTDGYGTPVAPQCPERWYWFLTMDYKHYIPPKSKTFMLSDYE